MTTDTITQGTFRSQMSNVLMIFCSIIVVAVHLVLYIYSKDVFNIVLGFYIIGFAVIFLVYLQKKKEYETSKEYTVLSYISFFVIGLELMVLILSFVSLGFKNNKYTYKPYNAYGNNYKY